MRARSVDAGDRRRGAARGESRGRVGAHLARHADRSGGGAQTDVATAHQLYRENVTVTVMDTSVGTPFSIVGVKRHWRTASMAR